MTLPIPYPVYGIVTDSNGTPLEGVTVSISDIAVSSNTTDSSGKYLINIQKITSIGNSVTISASCSGERFEKQWTVSVTGPGKRFDIALEEARLPGPIVLNTYGHYDHSLYILGTNTRMSHLKTIEYD